MSKLLQVLSLCTRKTSWGLVEDPLARDILSSPYFKLLEESVNKLELSFLEPLGAGVSHLVLDIGNNVLRIGFGTLQERVNLPIILQPLNSIQIGSLHYEILPKADIMNVTQEHLNSIMLQLNNSGYQWHDAGIDNIGLIEDNPVIIDSEGIKKIKNNPSYKIK